MLKHRYKRPIDSLLVTGGAGFIGSALIRYLMQSTAVRVVNVDALTYAGDLRSLAPVSGDPRYRFEHTDVLDGPAVAAILQKYRPNAIIHLAAESHVDRSIDAPANFIQTNIIGTYTLLEATLTYWLTLGEDVRRTFVFHHVSTDEVFGSLDGEGRFVEDSPYRPNSPYAASKAAADHIVRAWHRTYGLPVIITNCSNNFGPCQFPEKLIPLTIINALSGRALPVYGNGANVRDWLYVDDHARALWQVLISGTAGETYNIGANNERTNLDVVRSICAILDELRPASTFSPHASLVSFVPDRPGHDHRYAIEAARIRTELGWKPLETFESALEKTVRWYLDNEDWWKDILARRYAGDRLGLMRDDRASAKGESGKRTRDGNGWQ